MHPVIALALVMVAGIAATRLPRMPSFPPQLAMLGAARTHLLLLGLLLGPLSDVLNPATLHALNPVLALATGWLGARFGTRLEWRWLRRLPRRVWGLAALQAAAAALAVGLVTTLAVLLIPALRGIWQAHRAATVFAVAAIAAMSGPDLVALGARRLGIATRTVRALRAAATIDAALGLLVFTLALGGRRFGLLGGLPFALGLGVIVGLLFAWLTRLLAADDLTILVIGAILVAAGAGLTAGVPAFLVCSVMSATAARLSPRRQAVKLRLVAWHGPMLGVLVLLSGALLQVPTVWVVPLAIVLAAARAAARWAGVRYGRRWRPFDAIAPTDGLMGIAQDGAPLALGAGWYLARPGPGTAAAFFMIVVAAALAQAVAPWCMARAVRLREL